MKRYLLFVYDVGYDSYSGPKAWETFEGDFDSADEAEAEGKRQCDDGNVPYSSTGEAYQVVDTRTKEIIRQGSGERPEMTGRAPTAEEIARFPEMRPVNIQLAVHKGDDGLMYLVPPTN